MSSMFLSISLIIMFRFRFVDASLANKVEAVGYRRQYAAKIVSYQKNEGWFGTVKLAERFASGVDYDGVVVNVSSSRSENSSSLG